MNDTYILEEAAEIVYDRPEQHGDPEDSFQLIADFWNDYLSGMGIEDPDVTPIDVAYMMDLLKTARHLEGVYDDDNPRDKAGYMENVARLQEDETDDSPDNSDRQTCNECGCTVTYKELRKYVCDTCGGNPWPPIN